MWSVSQGLRFSQAVSGTFSNNKAAAELTTNRRQHSAWEHDALDHLRHGEGGQSDRHRAEHSQRHRECIFIRLFPFAFRIAFANKHTAIREHHKRYLPQATY